MWRAQNGLTSPPITHYLPAPKQEGEQSTEAVTQPVFSLKHGLFSLDSNILNGMILESHGARGPSLFPLLKAELCPSLKVTLES